MRLTSGRQFGRLFELVGSYVASSGALLASSIATLLTFGLLARSMGHEQFALNATIAALTTIGVQICGLGSTESLVRRVAQKPPFYPEMLGHVHILNLVSGVALTVIGMIALPLIAPVSDNLTVTLATTAIILFTNIFLLKIVWLATNSCIAHSRFATANKLEIMFAGLRMLAAVLGCLVFGVTTVVEWAMWNFAAHAIAALVSLVVLNRLGRPKFRIVREEVPLGIMFASQLFFKAVRNNADILVLSAVASSEILGSYSVARRLMEASYLSVDALNRILYPGSAAVALSGMDSVYQRAKRTLFMTTGISIATASTLWLASPFLPLLFGAEYVSLVWINQYLCWAVVPIAVSTTAFEALGSAGLQSVRARIANSSNFIGAGVVALATWYAGLDGVLLSAYGVEIVAAFFAWRALIRIAGAKAAQPAATAGRDSALATGRAD